MRILYVVQRYGSEIVGGSEAACRHFAERLVSRGHQVDVLTSCAHDYVDWSNQYEPGLSVVNGVTIHRLPVVEPRQHETFNRLHGWIVNYPYSAPFVEQQRWATSMGPNLLNFQRWLFGRAHEYDVVIFMTYLYATTTNGLTVVSGRTPTVLQPTAHDEPAAYVSLFQSLFRLADAFLFFTPEERLVVERLYRLEAVGSTIGIGLDLHRERSASVDVLKQLGIANSAYLVYVGRLDAMKGVGELIRFFEAYRSRNSEELKLVLVGAGQLDIPDRHDVIVAGFLSEDDKRNLIAHSLALVQPSYFESFSIVLCESWVEGRPALVQGKCEVLRGQAMRSGGALPYEGFAEFEACVNFLMNNPDVARSIGESGRRYVEDNYNWSTVIEGLEETLQTAIERFENRRITTRPMR